MKMDEALQETMRRPNTIARPLGWPRGGYYIANDRVWDYDPTRLGADLSTRVPRLATFPPASLALGEWEVIEL